MKIDFILVLVLLLTCVACDDNKEFLINTSKCQIPNFVPFHDDVKDMMIPQPYFSCNTSELLTYTEKLENKTVILHLRKDIPEYPAEDLNCLYGYVYRNGSIYEPDVGFSIPQYNELSNSVVLEHDTVKVVCFKNFSLIYQNVHNPVIIHNSVRDKVSYRNHTSKPLSILFVVVDSISRLNLIRTMPQTYQFFQENDFVEMKGYSKVDDNTFPNCMSLLTGLNLTDVYYICRPHRIEGLDKCPMIWYDYRQNGYITAYAEDNSPISTFNYHIKGFKNPPTDYYFKPYIEASEQLKIKYHNTMPYCTGPESAGERILNLAKDFAITFKNHSTFGLFWMNTFSHNEVNAPSGMDGRMKQFFVDLKNDGVLDESIVIFLSDHGIRMGEVRTTLGGWFEERLPANMISVPKTFQDAFPEEYKNLKKNSVKLTSTYDMFMTLQHILTLSGKSVETKKSRACPKCRSIFKNIPRERSCEDAGIPNEWCSCIGKLKPINETEEYVQNAIKEALEIITIQTDLNEPLDIEHVFSSGISDDIPSQKTRSLFVSFQTKARSGFVVTVKFKNYIHANSTFYIRQMY